MDNETLIERLQNVIDILKDDDDRDRAEGELYSIFDELEFISDDYEEEDDAIDDYEYD